jgi:gliding motility-associated-like protein
MDASRWKTTVALPGIQFTDKSRVDAPGEIIRWQWQFGDKNNSGSQQRHPYFDYPISEPSDTGLFRVDLRVETSDGCWDTTHGYIYIEPDITVFIPNAFTPNGYGESINERFYVIADGFEHFEISIFTRWGERVYTSSNIQEGWNGMYKGREAQQDVYVYVVKVTAVGGKQYEYYGTITLLR